MNWLEGFIYGLLSGITELLPVSSQAHQQILLQIFGVGDGDAVSNLVVHLSILIALFIGCRGLLSRLRREQRVTRRGKRRGMHSADARSFYDLRLIRTAIIPMLMVMLVWIFTRNWAANRLLIAVFSIINGFIIFIAERFAHANKDSRHMSVLDAVLFGISGALSVFPGISRVGISLSYAAMRGVDRQQSLNWTLLLSIPALLTLCVFDIVGIATGIGLTVSFSVIVGYITAAVGAFLGAYLCIFFIRTVINRSGMTAYAYYSWGIAMLTLVLYLIS